MKYYYEICPDGTMPTQVEAGRSDRRAIKEALRKAQRLADEDGRDMNWRVIDENGWAIAGGICRSGNKDNTGWGFSSYVHRLIKESANP